MAKPIKGKGGKFQGSVGEGKAKVPTAGPTGTSPAPSNDAATPSYSKQYERLAAGKATPLDDMADRLRAGKDSILQVREVEPADAQDVALVQSALDGNADGHPLVEKFDGGAIVIVNFVDGDDRHVIALANNDGVVAAVRSSDQGEADALYAGMAEQVNVLGESCEGCGKAIPSVYQYCADCV